MTKYGLEKVKAAKINGAWDGENTELTPGEKNKMVDEIP